MKRLALAAGPLALLVGLAGLAGCGVSTDDQPHEISQSNVPAGFDEETTTSEVAGTAQPGEEVGIWLVRDESGEVTLTRRTRTVPRPPTETAILEALLLEGPTRTERRNGITTAIPPSTRLASTPALDDGVLVVDLSDGFFDVAGFDLRDAYAQIVCTADEIPGVEAVAFEIEGERRDAFDGDGQSTSRPMRCSNYEQLIPGR